MGNLRCERCRAEWSREAFVPAECVGSRKEFWFLLAAGVGALSLVSVAILPGVL